MPPKNSGGMPLFLADEDDPLGFYRELASGKIRVELERIEPDRAEQFDELARRINVEWKRVRFLCSGGFVLIHPCTHHSVRREIEHSFFEKTLCAVLRFTPSACGEVAPNPEQAHRIDEKPRAGCERPVERRERDAVIGFRDMADACRKKIHGVVGLNFCWRFTEIRNDRIELDALFCGISFSSLDIPLAVIE